MKKILLIALLGISVSVQAQFSVSVNAGFDCAGTHNENASDHRYTLSPTLRAGYRLSDRLTVGITAGTEIGNYQGIWRTSNQPDIINVDFRNRHTINNLSWHAGLYSHYDFSVTEHLTLFADLAVTLGSYYTRTVIEYYNIHSFAPFDTTLHTETHTGNNAILFYGAVITPGLGYRFTPRLSIELHLDLLHLAYTHTAVTPKNSKKTTHYDTFKMGAYNYPIDYNYAEYSSFQPTGYRNSLFHIGATYTF